MKLVINGDDLGYTMANTMGIVEAYKNGILRSTTALGNSDYLAEAYALCKGCDDLGVGVHLTLTLGKPLTENKTLTAPNGEFWPGRKTVWEKNPDYDEIYNEWKAQIERFISIFHRKPTHLDSHHSVHDATPEALAVARRLADEYGLELRRYGSYKFVAGVYAATANKDDFIKLLEANAGEDIEIMCHPGFVDLELYRKSSYSLDRVKELDCLCNDEVKDYIKEKGIELAHY